jgi:mannose-6-phosphate isomerase-like protein (cupin superfamily)
MTIDFKKIDEAVIPNFKGGDKEIHTRAFFDGTNRICYSVLPPQASIGYHAHQGTAEIVYVLSGQGTVNDDGVESPIEAGQCQYCPNGHSHGVKNTGTEDLVVFNCVVKQA